MMGVAQCQSLCLGSGLGKPVQESVWLIGLSLATSSGWRTAIKTILILTCV